ncbi:MAG: hypothetical protein ACRDJW_21770 [Thermomicrobiales bacterium]
MRQLATSRGERETRWLEISPVGDDQPVRLPLLVARGHEDGPTIVVLGGVHGVDQSLAAPIAGFPRLCVNQLDRVSPGDLLGVIEDAAGEPLAEVRAPSAGVVMVRRESPPVQPGDIAFLLT